MEKLDFQKDYALFPFGMQEPERNWTATNYNYRYGYNGMEKNIRMKIKLELW